MDPTTHGRWLEYLELHEYFGDRRRGRLSQENWLELDAELARLADRAGRGENNADDDARARALRRVLHRD